MAIEIKSSLLNDEDFINVKNSLIKASEEDGEEKFRVKLVEYINDSSEDNNDMFFYDMLEFLRFLPKGSDDVAFTTPDKEIFLNAPGEKKIDKNIRQWEFVYDHECLHQLWDTFGVEEKIKQEKGKCDHYILNYASDCVINDYLYYSRKKERPSFGVFPEVLKQKYGVEYDRKKDTQYTLYIKLLEVKNKLMNDPDFKKMMEELQKQQKAGQQQHQQRQSGGNSSQSGGDSQDGENSEGNDNNSSSNSSNSDNKQQNSAKTAEDAQKAANEAKKAAEEAQEAADKAKENGDKDAEEKQKSADEAKKAAKEAQDAAEKAQEAGDSDDKDGEAEAAKEAQDAAEKAKQAANKAKGEKSEDKGDDDKDGKVDGKGHGEGTADKVESEVNLKEIKEKAQAIIEKYKNKLAGDFGEFIKKCKTSKDLKDTGLALNTTNGSTGWNEKMNSYINAFVKKKVFQKKRQYQETYSRVKRGSGFIEYGKPIKPGKKVREEKLNINVAFYVDRSGSMGGCIKEVFDACYIICESIKKKFKKESVVDNIEFKIYAFDHEMKELKYGNRCDARGGTMGFHEILGFMNKNTENFMINVIITDADFSIEQNEVDKFMKNISGMLLFITNNDNATMKKISKKYETQLFYVLADHDFKVK